MGVRHHAAHVRGRVVGHADADALGRLDHPLQHRVAPRGVDQQPAGGAAALPADPGEVRALHHRGRGGVGIHIFEDQDGVLAPQLQGEALEHARRAGSGLHGQPGAQRAGERHPGHIGVRDQGLARGRAARHHVEDPRRQQVLCQRGDHQRRQRGLLGRLEHHRVAGGQGGGGLHAREQGGMVVGAQGSHHTPGRGLGEVQPAGRGRDGAPTELGGDPGDGLEELAALGRAGRHGGDRGPAVAGVEQAQPGRGLHHTAPPFGQPGGPLVDAHRGPRRLGPGRGVHRPVDVGGPGLMDAGQHRAGGRADVVLHGLRAAHRRHAPAVDPHRDLGVGSRADRQVEQVLQRDRHHPGLSPPAICRGLLSIRPENATRAGVWPIYGLRRRPGRPRRDTTGGPPRTAATGRPCRTSASWRPGAPARSPSAGTARPLSG